MAVQETTPNVSGLHTFQKFILLRKLQFKHCLVEFVYLCSLVNSWGDSEAGMGWSPSCSHKWRLKMRGLTCWVLEHLGSLVTSPCSCVTSPFALSSLWPYGIQPIFSVDRGLLASMSQKRERQTDAVLPFVTQPQNTVSLLLVSILQEQITMADPGLRGGELSPNVWWGECQRILRRFRNNHTGCIAYWFGATPR